jgi:hypothetical protein
MANPVDPAAVAAIARHMNGDHAAERSQVRGEVVRLHAQAVRGAG